MILFFIAVSFACQTLSGTWVNELGSIANIHAKSGFIDGDYTSAVGAASGSYPLVGSYTRGVCEMTFGFVVTWDKPSLRGNTTTAWTGVMLNGTLYTTWLLTQPVDVASAWKATNIGTNVFYRAK